MISLHAAFKTLYLSEFMHSDQNRKAKTAYGGYTAMLYLTLESKRFGSSLLACALTLLA